MRAVTTQLQLAAITSVLSSDDCPTVLLGVRDHPATIDALVDMAVALARRARGRPGGSAVAGRRPGIGSCGVGRRRRARPAAPRRLGVRDESATLAALDAVDDATLAGLRVVLVVTDTFHPAQVPFLRRLAGSRRAGSVSVVPAATDTALLDQLRALGCDDVPRAARHQPDRG